MKEKNQRQALAQKRYRERKKMKMAAAELDPEQNQASTTEPNLEGINPGNVPVASSTPETISSKKKSRAVYHKVYRKSRSRQKKQVIKEKDRERKRKSTNEAPKKTLRRRSKRNALSPCSYANNIDALIEAATPSKELELAKRNLNKRKERVVKDTICQGVSDLYSETSDSSLLSVTVRKKVDTTIAKRIRKKRLGSQAAKVLIRDRRSFSKYSVKSRGKPSIKDSTKSVVLQFYHSNKISKERPEKRFMGKRLMTLPSL